MTTLYLTLLTSIGVGGVCPLLENVVGVVEGSLLLDHGLLRSLARLGQVYRLKADNVQHSWARRLGCLCLRG